MILQARLFRAHQWNQLSRMPSQMDSPLLTPPPRINHCQMLCLVPNTLTNCMCGFLAHPNAPADHLTHQLPSTRRLPLVLIVQVQAPPHFEKDEVANCAGERARGQGGIFLRGGCPNSRCHTTSQKESPKLWQIRRAGREAAPLAGWLAGWKAGGQGGTCCAAFPG